MSPEVVVIAVLAALLGASLVGLVPARVQVRRGRSRFVRLETEPAAEHGAVIKARQQGAGGPVLSSVDDGLGGESRGRWPIAHDTMVRSTSHAAVVTS